MQLQRFHASPLASLPAVAVAALLAAAAPGAAGEKHRAVVRIGGDDAAHAFAFTDGDEHAVTVEVTVEGGAVSVRLNGEDVPEDRIVRKDGAIVILDADGKAIEEIDVAPFGGGAQIMKLRVGDDDGRVWIMGDDAPAETPAVMMGIRLDAPGPALAHHLRINPDEVTMITALYEGLPAQKAGLEPYDLITAIDGATPADPRTLRQALADRAPGDALTLSVIHRGAKKDVKVTLVSFDRATLEEAAVIGEGDRDRTIIFSPDVLRGRLRLPPGLRSFELDELEDMDGLLLDDRNRLFEWRRGFGAPRTDREDGGGVDDRLRRLDRRLEGLERLLDELLEQAERDAER